MSRINLKAKNILIGAFVEWITTTEIEGKITRCKFKLENGFVKYNTKNKYHITYLGFIRIEWRIK